MVQPQREGGRKCRPREEGNEPGDSLSRKRGLSLCPRTDEYKTDSDGMHPSEVNCALAVEVLHAVEV
eukprot:scaffold1720_cov353-Pavlova_lutheri.AAC.1